MHPVCCSWSFVSCDGNEEEEAPKKKSKGKGKGKKSEDRKSKKKCKYGRWKKRCAPRWACCGRLLGAGCAERAVVGSWVLGAQSVLCSCCGQLP